MGAVVTDRWDPAELGAAMLVPAFETQRNALGARYRWGAQACDDLFYLLYKARPELREVADPDAGEVVVHVLVSLLAANCTVQRLRTSTMRDICAAASAAAQLAPALETAVEGISVDDSALALAQESDETWLQELTERRREQLALDVFDQADTDGLEVVAEEAARQEETMAAAAEAWGLGQGELRQLPLEERLALAERLDTDRVRLVAELFGRLRLALLTEHVEATGPGVEPVGVELGDDLARLVGSELMSLEADLLFFARLGEGNLGLYQMEGPDTLGRGGIVLCVDCSWSMTTEHEGFTREAWATAFKLFLLRLAMRENRPMHVINFSGPGETDYHRFVDPEERTLDRALASATNWFGYGTDFVGPLRQAVTVLADHHDRDADVVFVSDGLCSLSARAIETYQRATRRRGVRTWGVQMGPKPGTLQKFCDRIFTVSDLTSGNQLGNLLDAVER